LSATAWDFAPVASPALRPRGRRARRGSWAWWLATVLHAALLAALFVSIDPETLPEPQVVEGTPMVWEGPVGAAEGAPELSTDLPASLAEPAPAPEAPSPSAPAEAPAEAAASRAPPSVAPAGGAPGDVPAPEAAAAQAAPPAATSMRPVAPRLPSADPAPTEALPLPPPAAPPPPAPARPAPAAPPAPVATPAAPGAPMRMVEVPLATTGAIRLGAGSAGAPGESRAVGAPQPGCQDMIGYPPSERARGITGAVNLRLRVSDDGRVVEARITEPSGSFALDEAARSGIRRCRFIPSLRDGIAVWGSRDYRVVFRLD